ncbi:MAG: HAMP domain-containing histidine kinase [Bacteroidales bacterium]|jgi:signal transduction histidine kinase|nr:HAMP domain-containing histidine kinase [Bacteroidales bacterium]
MKLLTKTSRYYLILSGIVFIISGLIFYHLLQRVFYTQLDRTLKDEKLLIEETINYSDSVPDFRTIFGHLIEVTILYQPNRKAEFIHDTIMYNGEQGKFLSYRHLFAENTSIRNKGYTINIYKPLHETETLVAGIVIVIALVFISLLILLVILNYIISRRVWIPFHRILYNLGSYDINQEKPLKLVKTDIYEFGLLNQAMEKMSNKIRQDFINLKEFNENAAHELQTPLAVIKSKLDLLIQHENLNEDQLQLISSVYDATTRMSKLNQGLLLISKIENEQFTTKEEINLSQVIDKTLEHFEEMIDHLHIEVIKNYQESVIIRINRILAEIMITNLVSNAIKHNHQSGSMNIVLTSARLIISNSGQPLGVDPDDLFERFRKSGTSGDSVGLGLSIVRKIAQLYHMQINYQYADGIHSLLLSF